MGSSLASYQDPFETITISDRAAQQIDRGGLWVFSNEVKKKSGGIRKGAWCHFQTKSKKCGTGYFNPHSLIAGRVVARTVDQDISTILSEKILAAFRRRSSFSPYESCRLIFSEADLLPGLILDYFSGVLVLQTNTAGIDVVLPLLEKIIPDSLNQVFGITPRAFLIRGDTPVRSLEQIDENIKMVLGEESELKDGQFRQDGISYAADFLEGQKTGFFLDQRNNRQQLLTWAKNIENVRMLDLFCYSGGWGLSALKWGASHVTFVDQSEAALSLVRRGAQLNQFPQEKVAYVDSDVFDYLEHQESMYDVIVVDPPAFVKSKKNLPQAINAYEKLNRLAWRRLKSGGILVTCSCSYHLSEPDFLSLLQNAIGKEKSLAHVVFRGSQSSDHPILLSMPETHYLKCLGLQKI